MFMLSTFFSFFTIVIFGGVYYSDFKYIHRIKEQYSFSFSSGIGVVYVFIYMLPHLAKGQHLMATHFQNHPLLGGPYAMYIVALIGFIFFYVFDTFLTHTRRLPTDDYDTRSELAFYWTSVMFVCLYSLLIGYVVGSYASNDLTYQFKYLIAYVIHFLAIKYGIYHIFPEKYDKVARYPIVASLFLGYFIASFADILPITLAISETTIEAFLTGAMILTVFKHELPNEKDSKTWAFSIGILVSLALFTFL